MPLEITFAPTRLNIHEAEAVIGRARSLGAFRFNSGKLMRLGTAARQWHRLEPTPTQYRDFRDVLAREARVEPPIELCYLPWTVADGLCAAMVEPPATLLVLPNGWVKVAAPLPGICADLRSTTLSDAWDSYRAAWRSDAVKGAMHDAIDDESRHAEANRWQMLPASKSGSDMEAR